MLSKVFVTCLLISNAYQMTPRTIEKSNPYKKSNIFNSGDYKLLLDRIESLSDSSPRQWGTMTLPEMLEHCSIQLKMALFEIQGTKKKVYFF